MRVEAADACFYPDVLVHCTQPAHPGTTTELTEARLVVEVLSPTTQLFDRADKLKAYRQLAGLQHIVLLSSMEQAAWSCERVTADSAWTDMQPWPRGTALRLPGLGIEIGLDEVYEGVGL